VACSQELGRQGDADGPAVGDQPDALGRKHEDLLGRLELVTHGLGAKPSWSSFAASSSGIDQHSLASARTLRRRLQVPFGVVPLPVLPITDSSPRADLILRHHEGRRRAVLQQVGHL
jgi:hypothetical protein